jgi:glutamine amidotransferase-like uncharacterized protein
MISITRVVLFSILLMSANVWASPILVYRDAGVCPENCAEAVGDLAAEHFGSVKYVKASQITQAALKTAKIWIQPGGNAIEAAELMTAEQKALLRNFVAQGGSYLGICAGAFLADHFADDFNQVPGLGLIPGVSLDFLPGNIDDLILQVTWHSVPRYLYFQAGATFKFDNSRPVQIIARYADGRPAVVQFPYGKGTVVLSGPHPEAPKDWKTQLNDFDGEDFDLVTELFNRADRHFLARQ